MEFEVTRTETLRMGHYPPSVASISTRVSATGESIMGEIQFGRSKGSCRSVLAAITFIGLLVLGLCMQGCGDDPPSRYCCEAKACSGDKPVCDGSGDDCYCRAARCCERISCPADYECHSDSFDNCMCSRVNNKLAAPRQTTEGQ